MSVTIFFNFQDDGGESSGRQGLYRLFDAIFDGCPNIETFNGVDLTFLRQHQLTRRQWSYYALRVCVRHYKKKFGHKLTAARAAAENER